MISLNLLFQHATSQTHNPVNVIIARTLSEYGLQESQDHFLVDMQHETFKSELQPKQSWVVLKLNIKCPKCSEVHTLNASALVSEDDPIELAIKSAIKDMLQEDIPQDFIDFLQSLEGAMH